jgi:hypothetical protein
MQKNKHVRYSVLVGRNLRQVSSDDLKQASSRKRRIQDCMIDGYSCHALGPEASHSLDVPNAGGNSVMSEACSIQYFVDLGATNILLEKQVVYNFYGCKMVDFIATWKNQNIGVSVARAMTWNVNHPFDKERAKCLLIKKLSGLVIARNCVSDQHAFFLSILHIQCETDCIAQLLSETYRELLLGSRDWSDSLKGTLSLILTVIHPTSKFFRPIFNKKTQSQISSP